MMEQTTIISGGVFNARPHAVESWVAELPLADIGTSFRLVFDTLAEMNAATLTQQERFKTLEILRQPIQYLHEAVMRPHIAMSLPPSPVIGNRISALQDLHLEATRGYQHIVDNQLAEDNFRQDFNLLATSVHRALYYHGQALLSSYQLYRPAAAEDWRDIHHYYDVAERKGLQSSEVKDGRRNHPGHTTVETQYKQILLLALADPHRLTPADMAQVYTLLEQWAPQCRLYPATHFDETPNTCIVNLEGDSPPSYLVYSSITQYSTCRLLDLNLLIKTVRDLLPLNPPKSLAPLPTPRGERSSERWRSLVQHLLAAWGMTAKRRFTRAKSNAVNVEIAQGLNTIHHCLGGSILGLNDKSSFGHHSTPPAHSDDQALRHSSYSCSIVNESANGVCVKQAAMDPGELRIGELLAISRELQGGYAWDIAVIRWLKALADNSAEFGIQLLAPDAIPIAVRLHNEQESEHDFLRGLYLPEVNALRQPESLIVPAFLFHVDDHVSVKMEHGERRLQLTRALESNRIYSRFQFSPSA